MIVTKTDSPYTNAQLVEQSVAKGEVPRYLYKYRGTDIYTKRIIQNRAIWYSRPSTFNDPFDCQLTIECDGTSEDIYQFLLKNNLGFDKAELRSKAIRYAKNPDLLRAALNQAAKTQLNENGLSCFTGDPANILMWSHYSESHKGICLKFDVLADPRAFFAPFKVEYEEEYPVWNHIKTDVGESTRKLITTKAKAWEYEQEYRVLKFGDPSNHGFKKEALVEIIFGYKASESFIAEIKALVKMARMDHIAFSRASVNSSEFKLNIIPLE